MEELIFALADDPVRYLDDIPALALAYVAFLRPLHRKLLRADRGIRAQLAKLARNQRQIAEHVGVDVEPTASFEASLIDTE